MCVSCVYGILLVSSAGVQLCGYDILPFCCIFFPFSMDMGFSLNSCKRALTAVGGSDVAAAMDWAFQHNTDADFNDPLPETTSDGHAATSSSSNVDEGVVQSLVENLGCFTADQVRAALQETNGAADRAADWLFSHMDDLDGAIAALRLSKQEDESSPSSRW
jgi:uncharacterized UBP type Zn finger protein